MQITDWPPYPPSKPKFSDFALAETSHAFMCSLSELLDQSHDAVTDLVFDSAPRRMGGRTRLSRGHLWDIYLKGKLPGVKQIAAGLFAALPKLHAINLADNTDLERVDLSDCNQLDYVHLDGCFNLRTVVLNGCPSVYIGDDIESQEFRDDLAVWCSDLTVHHNYWRRDRLTLNTYVASTVELHSYIYDHPQLEVKSAMWVVEHENCDIATAIAAYWKLSPLNARFLRSYEHAKKKMMEEYVIGMARIEHRIESGELLETGIAYDFAHDMLRSFNKAWFERWAAREVPNFRIDLPDDVLQPIGYIGSIEAEMLRDKIRSWQTGTRTVGFAGLLANAEP